VWIVPLSLRKLLGRSAKFSRQRRRPTPCRPRLESLEERLVLSNTLFVNTTGSGGAFTSIQAAVNAAQAGDTIVVAAGTYHEQVNVNKTLTLEGAQAGVDARSRSGPESIVDGNNGTTPFEISANNVTLDGFTVQGQTNANVFGAGVYITPGVSGTQLDNDIIQNNMVGLFLANTGASQAVITQDLFRNNNQPGPASGQGIYTDQFTAGGPVSNVLISNNSFVGNQNAGIDVSTTDTTNPDSNFTISGNSFDSNGRGILLFNTTASVLTDNSITNSTLPTDGGHSVAIGLYGNDSNLSITCNQITNGLEYGIRLGDFIGGPSPNTNVSIHANAIYGFASADVIVESGGYVGPLDATYNWWGSAKGPPPGSIVGDVNYQPWLVAPADTSTQRFWTDGQNTLIVDTATGNFAFFEADGTVFAGDHARVRQGRLEIHSEQNGDVFQASGPVHHGDITVTIQGPDRHEKFRLGHETNPYPC
jgi:parallel beta-helix repeat protein